MTRFPYHAIDGFQFELLYTMNTPGTANGVVKYWVDGIQQFSATNVTIRTAGSTITGFDTFLLVTNWDFATLGDYWYVDDVEVWDSPPRPTYALFNKVNSLPLAAEN